MSTHKTDTLTLAAAMDALARDIQSTDGVANAAIAEAAQRLRELDEEQRNLMAYIELLESVSDSYGLAMARRMSEGFGNKE